MKSNRESSMLPIIVFPILVFRALHLCTLLFYFNVHFAHVIADRNEVMYQKKYKERKPIILSHFCLYRHSLQIYFHLFHDCTMNENDLCRTVFNFSRTYTIMIKIIFDNYITLHTSYSSYLTI